MRLDRHALYERAVQSPERDVEALAALFRARARRHARTLREDFCGTAALSIAWVGSDDDREATAIDLDRDVLVRARSSARARLEADERARLRILRRDVRDPPPTPADLVVAANFSWAILEDDRDLARYLEGAARSLARDGMLVLEIFGGADLRRPLVHRHRHEGFVYAWEHRAFDGARELLDARIHFELDDGRVLRDAFRYAFRLRSLARMRALLAAAGLPRVELLVEDRRGGMTSIMREPRRTSWNGWLLARAPGGRRGRGYLRAQRFPRDSGANGTGGIAG